VKRREEIARFSPRDADAEERWDAWMAGLADVLGPLLSAVPPKVGSRHPADLADQARLVWRLRGLDTRKAADVTRLFTLSIADLLEEYFESPELQAVHAVSGVIGTWAGPRAPGTAYVMAHHHIGDVGDGNLGSWGLRRGRHGRGHPGRWPPPPAPSGPRSAPRPRSGASPPGTAASTGVVLEGGQELASRRRGGGHPPPDHLPEQVDRAELPATSSPTSSAGRPAAAPVKVEPGRRPLPRFTCRPEFDPEIHGGTIVLAESLDDMEGAFQDAAAGRPSAVPFADVCIPSVFDKTLAPEGHHIVSMFTQWVPHTWAGKPMD
jgi:phytoene dehydrogenase-like protein